MKRKGEGKERRGRRGNNCLFFAAGSLFHPSSCIARQGENKKRRGQFVQFRKKKKKDFKDVDFPSSHIFFESPFLLFSDRRFDSPPTVAYCAIGA